jgi:hypothetical protein
MPTGGETSGASRLDSGPDSFPSQNENGRTFNQHGRVGDLLKETGFGPDPVPDQIRGVDEQIDVFAEAAQGSFDTAVL